MNADEKPSVSVVVPVYRSEDCVVALVEALAMAFTKSSRTYEVLLVNDSSPDGSWEEIRRASQAYPSVVGISLRRNFGQDSAILAGIRHAQGDVVVVMDDDLQHDPEDIEKLVSEVEEGADVCYAHFGRKNQAWWKNAGSWFNGRVANWVLNKPRDVYMSPFKAMSSDVAREIARYDGPFPYVDGLLFQVTDRFAQVDAEHHARHAGEGNYSLRRSVAVWLSLATSFSLGPLRLATYLGFVFSGLGFALAIYFVWVKYLLDQAPSGWASLIVTGLVLGGVQLSCIGMIGEYLGRTYLHVNRRPQSVIREVVRKKDEG